MIFLLNECKERGLDFKDTWGEKGWTAGKSSGCIRGFRFCLSSTIHFLSDCSTVTSDSFPPFLASKINLAFFPFFWLISSARRVLLFEGGVFFYCLRRVGFGWVFLLLLLSWGFFLVFAGWCFGFGIFLLFFF